MMKPEMNVVYSEVPNPKLNRTRYTPRREPAMDERVVDMTTI